MDVSAEPSGRRRSDLRSRWIEISGLQIDRLAASTALLLETERSWVARRCERYEFLDGRRVSKSVNVQLVVPEDPRGTAASCLALPLARPRKRFLRNLRIIDETGRLLTYLTRDVNALVSTSFLLLQARRLGRRRRLLRASLSISLMSPGCAIAR